jgi:hypothetical protein
MKKFLTSSEKEPENSEELAAAVWLEPESQKKWVSSLKKKQGSKIIISQKPYFVNI